MITQEQLGALVGAYQEELAQTGLGGLGDVMDDWLGQKHDIVDGGATSAASGAQGTSAQSTGGGGGWLDALSNAGQSILNPISKAVGGAIADEIKPGTSASLNQLTPVSNKPRSIPTLYIVGGVVLAGGLFWFLTRKKSRR